MPLAVVLFLTPLDRCAIPLSHGALAHAAAVHLLQCLDAGLFPEIHGSHQRCRPFTTSPLGGPLLRKGTWLTLSPDRTYTWRLTGLNDSVCEALKRVTPGIGALRLGQAVLRVERTADDAAFHPDAGEVSYQCLWERWQDADAPATITLTFVTPTTFRVGKFERPFPTPRLVFRNLWEQWNTHAQVHLNSFPDNIVNSVILSNWKGETKRVEMGSERTVGFVGRFAVRLSPYRATSFTLADAGAAGRICVLCRGRLADHARLGADADGDSLLPSNRTQLSEGLTRQGSSEWDVGFGLAYRKAGPRPSA